MAQWHPQGSGCLAMLAAERMIATEAGPVLVRDSGGVGPAIVLLHGSASSGDVFARQFKGALAARHRLITLDLPGHGRSADADDPSRYTLTGLTGIVSDILDKFRLGGVTLFGWSLGGHLAMQLASERTDINGIMLTGAPPVARGPLGLMRGFQANWDLLLVSKRTFSERDIRRFGELCFGPDPEPAFLAAIRRADGRLRAEFFRSLLRGDFADQKRLVETSPVPVAIVNGERDPFVRLAYVQHLHYAALWRERCHLIPATGHAPFWHSPELFNPLLAAFAHDAQSEAGRTRAGLRKRA